MTYDDDMLRLVFKTGQTINIPCKNAGIEWPPPEHIEFEGLKFKQKRHSQITDKQRGEMSHVFRGAEYVEV